MIDSVVPSGGRNAYRAVVALFALFVLIGCSGGNDSVQTDEPDSSTATSTSGSNVAEAASTPVPPTTTTTTPTTTTTAAPTTTRAPTLDECLALIPLDVRLGQLLFPVITQPELPEATSLAAAGHIAGVVLIGSADTDIVADLATLQAASVVGASIVAIDEEGGRVQRIADLVGTLPSARGLAAESSSDGARTIHRDHAAALGNLGFTMNLAPVLDLDTGVYIRDRSFSDDPAVVTEYGLAVADGILDAGLTPVVKHFPGHGRGSDSHTGLPTVPPLDELRAADLIPFEAAIARGDLPVMIGHLVVPGLTDGQPASISPEVVTDLLRDDLGFDGLVMTDALNMDAIAIGLDGASAATRAVLAGVDLAMVGRLTDVPDSITQLESAVRDGTLDERSVNESFARVMEAKDIDICAIPAEVAPAIRCEGVTGGGCSLVAG